MLIRNSQTIPPRHRTLHGGQGTCATHELYQTKDLETKLLFINQTIIPPGATVGYHTHGEDEEVYVILSGRAVMTVNSERREVAAGDVLLNRRGWSHGLENPYDQPVTTLVFLVRM